MAMGHMKNYQSITNSSTPSGSGQYGTAGV
jgi:hypothetical protein